VLDWNARKCKSEGGRENNENIQSMEKLNLTKRQEVEMFR
jgi:hypothetical protein